MRKSRDGEPLSLTLEGEAALLAVMHLANVLESFRHGWGRAVRARKKFNRRQIKIGFRRLRDLAVIGPRSGYGPWAGRSPEPVNK